MKAINLFSILCTAAVTVISTYRSEYTVAMGFALYTVLNIGLFVAEDIKEHIDKNKKN